MDAWDLHTVREISLQWGTRLGKTFFGQCCLLYTADVDPCPMMHANANEKVCVEVLGRLYAMINFKERLRALLAKNEQEQRQDLVEFLGCKVYSAWSKSVTTLADKNIKVGHAAEIPKWVHTSTSKEAHPLKLFSDRFKDFWSNRKIIWEGTPTIKGRCPIEAKLQAGSNCRLWVPCRACKRYQTLDWSRLKYDKPESGRLDADLAYQTAGYHCRHCEHRHTNDDRFWMIRRGVWCPQGCEVDDAAALQAAEARMLQGPAGIQASGDDGAGVPRQYPEKWRGWSASPWIKGTPYRDGDHASYQLSSLYALSLSWSDIAKEWVECFAKAETLRNFVNQWLAETWEPRRQKSTAEQVADRLGTKRPARLVPAWARFLTLTVDRQAADGNFAKWMVMAHGPEDRAAVIAYGLCAPQDPRDVAPGEQPRHELELVEQIAWNCTYPAEDGGPDFSVSIAGVDSGWNTKQTYEFCNARQRWFPIKGDSGHLGGELYKIATLGAKTRSGATGQTLIEVSTELWEEEIDDRLHNPEKKADGPGCLSFCEEAARDWDFLDEMLNGMLGDAKTARGELRNQWKKRRENDPNDYRDAARYGLALGRAWLDANDGAYPQRSGQRQTEKKPTTPDEPHGYVRSRSAPIRRSRR